MPATSICLCEFHSDKMLRLAKTNRSVISYAVYVLEASTSNRLTYFLPPLVRAPTFALLVEDGVVLALDTALFFHPRREDNQGLSFWTNKAQTSLAGVGSAGP